MKLFVVLVLVTLTLAQDNFDEERAKRQSAFYQQSQLAARGPQPKPQYGGQQLAQRYPGLGGPSPQGFRVAPVDEDDDEVDHNAVTPSQAPLLLVRQNQASQQQAYRRPQAQQAQSGRRTQGAPPRGQLLQEAVLEEELEEDKPDRLTELLPLSKFDCSSKKTGYYADDGLNCEVFHYCQDNAKHSWICPEGFLFHQVHLICMPPSGDNICKQSSQYHFVNEYLYRPLNQEEHLNKPNVSLRYSDRYYPENYYEEGDDQSHIFHHRVPVQQQQQQQGATAAPPRSKPVQFQSNLRPVQFAPQQFRQPAGNQVFHSPEEVNIPLQHRRPVTSSPQRNFQQSNEDEYEYEDSPYRQG